MHEVEDDVRGLWFGIFEELEPDQSQHFTMYVTGAPGFAADDSGEWACDCTWSSPDRYLRLSGLASFDSEEWPLALEHAVAVVRAVAPWETAPPTVLGAGVGFDGGDVNVVWVR